MLRKTHLTEKLISQSGKFTLIIAGDGQKQLAMQVGSLKGEDTDKFGRFSIKTTSTDTSQALIPKRGGRQKTGNIMDTKPAIAVVGTFDSKAEEHIFLRDRIQQGGLSTLTINVGTRVPSPVEVDLDLYKLVIEGNITVSESRDKAIGAMIQEAKARIKHLYDT